MDHTMALPYLTFRVYAASRRHSVLRHQVGPLRIPVKPVG